VIAKFCVRGAVALLGGPWDVVIDDIVAKLKK